MNNVVEAFVGQAKWVRRIAVKRRWLALGTAACVAVVSAAVISIVPERYEASARIYVDTQTVLKPLMADLTYQPDIDQKVRMLARTLISQPNVDRLVRTPGLQFDVSNDAVREAAVARLMDQIKVIPTSSTSGNLYDITYRGPSPDSAKRLVEATVNMFVHAGVGAKQRESQDAGRFIEDQIRNYEAKLVEAEGRLKEFKLRNFGVSGVSNQDYFARVSVLAEEVSKLRVELSAAEQSSDSYRRELAVEEPQLPAVETEARLDTQRKLLDDLLRNYTDAHPDVLNTRRIIARLEVESRERRAAGDRASAAPEKATRPAKAAKAATSPVYQKLRISLADSDARVMSLRSELAAQQGRLDQVRSVAGRVPQVEAEYAQLNRDYEVIRKNYEVMVARRESASLGVKLDASSQLADFRVVEPPRVSRAPVFPGRLHLALMALLASAALGIAAAVLAELVWPTFEEAASLRLLSGYPVLGSVSKLVTPESLRAQRSSRLRFATAAGGLMALQVAWMVWIVLKSSF